MQTANEDALIHRFYDALFHHAAHFVRSGQTHPPVIVALEPTGMAWASDTSDLDKESRASLLMSLATNPKFQAAALVAETWYADARDQGANVDEFLKLASQGRLRDYKGRREAIVITVLTIARQALMICPIDRATNSVHKAAFEWIHEDSAIAVTGTYIRPVHATPN